MAEQSVVGVYTSMETVEEAARTLDKVSKRSADCLGRVITIDQVKT